MKRKISALFLAALAVLSMAAACPAEETPPPANQPMTLEEALAACGPDCSAVIFTVDLFDQHGSQVLLDEGYEAELRLDGFATTPEGPAQIMVWDVTKTKQVTTPYDYTYRVPLTDIQIADPDIIQISYEATVFLPPGWTLKCQATDNGVEASHDLKTNNEGLPVDVTVFCSWPGFIDIP